MNPTGPGRPRGRSKPMQPATEPEEVTFRETRLTDIEGLFEVRAATRENSVSRDALARLGITADSVAAGLSGGRTKGWVCEHGSRVVGFCTGDLATGEVLVLAVLPQYEDLGIGRKLLSLVVGQLSAARARRVWLAASSDPAVRSYGFYRALGWRATGERTGSGDEILVLGVTVHPVTDSEATAASAVVNESFTELASRDWDLDARETFLAGSSPEELAGKIKTAAYAAGAFAAGQMAGFLLMPAPSLLGMLFVHPNWLRQGVARTLWESARAHIKAEFPAVKTVELNSTPCAVEFYRSVGFVPISAEFRRGGARATRMACWLPARSLGAEIPPDHRKSGPG